MNDIYEGLHRAELAVVKLQEALGLPWRPVPLQPIADIKRYVASLHGRIAEQDMEIVRLRAALAEMTDAD